MEEQVARMVGLSGGSMMSKPFKYLVPLIRFNGNTGEFRKISNDENGNKVETPITKPFKFVILKKRKLLSSFSTNTSYFTNEYDTPNVKVCLFKNVAGVVSFEKIGFGPDLRAEFQALKTHEVIYLLHEGEVCKFEVKGGSLGNYYDYLTSLNNQDLHTFQVNTILDSIKTKNEAGFGYFAVTFTSEPTEVALDLIESQMNEVSDNIAKVDAFFTQKIKHSIPDTNSNGQVKPDPVHLVGSNENKTGAALTDYPEGPAASGIPF